MLLRARDATPSHGPHFSVATPFLQSDFVSAVSQSTLGWAGVQRPKDMRNKVFLTLQSRWPRALKKFLMNYRVATKEYL